MGGVLECWQDVEDANPLLRALAIRTMGCIRVDKILDYLSLPLGKGLKVIPPARVSAGGR